MSKVVIFSLVFYGIYLILSKLILKQIQKTALVIANSMENIENKEYTKGTSNRVTLKISPPLAIVICFVPVLNIILDIVLFIFLFIQLLVLVAMQNA